MSNWFTTKNHDKLNVTNYNQDNIYLFCQFFIHEHTERYNEIKFCLKKNIELGLFTKIILFNERIYSNQELGLNDCEMLMVTQIDCKKRLKFNDCFNEKKSFPSARESISIVACVAVDRVRFALSHAVRRRRIARGLSLISIFCFLLNSCAK